jgi:hypothetical protein
MRRHETAWFDSTAGPTVLVDRLVSNLAFGRIRSVAFVVPSNVSWTLPLYDVAIATARRGWTIGIEDVRYWLVTPEAEPVARLGTAVSDAASQRLEPEGIAFVGSTYADVGPGVVWLDPPGESLEVDVVVSLGESGGFDVTSPVGVGRNAGQGARTSDAATTPADGDPQPVARSKPGRVGQHEPPNSALVPCTTSTNAPGLCCARL